MQQVLSNALGLPPYPLAHRTALFLPHRHKHRGPMRRHPRPAPAVPGKTVRAPNLDDCRSLFGGRSAAPPWPHVWGPWLVGLSATCLQHREALGILRRRHDSGHQSHYHKPFPEHPEQTRPQPRASSEQWGGGRGRGDLGPGHCLVTPGGGGGVVWGPAQPRRTHPPTHRHQKNLLQAKNEIY